MWTPFWSVLSYSAGETYLQFLNIVKIISKSRSFVEKYFGRKCIFRCKRFPLNGMIIAQKG